MWSQFLMAVLLAAVPQNLLDSGRQALEAGDLTRAEQLFRQHLRQHPSSAEALSNLGAICSHREHFREAVTFYDRALSANPQLIPVHFNIAAGRGRLNECAKAALHLPTVLQPY